VRNKNIYLNFAEGVHIKRHFTLCIYNNNNHHHHVISHMRNDDSALHVCARGLG